VRYARKNAVVTAKELASNANIRTTLTGSAVRVGATGVSRSSE
jgi:hypothetical protein